MESAGIDVTGAEDCESFELCQSDGFSEVFYDTRNTTVTPLFEAGSREEVERRDSLISSTIDSAKEALGSAMTDEQLASHASRVKQLLTQMLSGDRCVKLVATVVSGLLIASRAMQNITFCKAAAASLRQSATVIRQPIVTNTMARCLDVAAIALENEQVTTSLSNSLAQTAATLENETVAATVEVTAESLEKAFDKTMKIMNLALQNERLSEVAHKISTNEVVKQSVTKTVEIMEQAMETSAVRTTVQTGKYIARKTLSNRHVQTVGKTALDVAFRVAGDERVQTFASKNIEFAATAASAVVNNQGFNKAFRLGSDVATAGMSAVESIWVYASAPASLVPASFQKRTPERQLLLDVVDECGLSGQCSDLHALLAESEAARRALMTLALQARKELESERHAHARTLDYANELSIALAAGVRRLNPDIHLHKKQTDIALDGRLFAPVH